MNKHVTAPAVVDERLSGRGVAGNDDATVGRLESIAEGIDHLLVTHGKCRDCHVVVPIDHAGYDLVHLDLVARRIVAVEPAGTRIDVNLPSFDDALGHRLEPSWAIDRKRLVPAHH